MNDGHPHQAGMNHPFHWTARRWAALAVLLAFAAFPAAGAAAVEHEAPLTGELPPVKIHRKTNPGDLPYQPFVDVQTYVLSLVPPDARMIELRQRVNFNGLSEAAKDAYLPESWAVAIVGDAVDQTVPVSRGGYFLLPELPPAAAQGASIMFNTQTRKGYLSMVWKLRIPEAQTLAYADFARALDEAAAVQRSVPWYRYNLRNVRRTGFDALRACFLDGGGRIEVDGQPAATSASGVCHVLRFDPGGAQKGGATIAFIGPLDIVILH